MISVLVATSSHRGEAYIKMSGVDLFSRYQRLQISYFKL